MKTKVVYVVASSDDYYLEQAWVSAASLKYYNDRCECIFLADKGTEKKISLVVKELGKVVDSIVYVDTPDNYPQVAKSRYIKTSMKKYITGDFLFLDTDTIVTGSLSEIDNIDGDVLMVKDVHEGLSTHIWGEGLKWSFINEYGINPTDDDYFNTGVILVRDNKNTVEFFERWHSMWRIAYEKTGLYFDQRIPYIINQELKGITQELPDVYNVQILGSIKYLCDAKIIHYFNAQWLSDKADYFVFFRKDVFERIKNDGKIDDSVMEYIINCKSGFDKQTFIVNKLQYDFLAHNETQRLYHLYRDKRDIYDLASEIWMDSELLDFFENDTIRKIYFLYKQDELVIDRINELAISESASKFIGEERIKWLWELFISNKEEFYNYIQYVDEGVVDFMSMEEAKTFRLGYENQKKWVKVVRYLIRICNKMFK